MEKELKKITNELAAIRSSNDEIKKLPEEITKMRASFDELTSKYDKLVDKMIEFSVSAAQVINSLTNDDTKIKEIIEETKKNQENRITSDPIQEKKVIIENIRVWTSKKIKSDKKQEFIDGLADYLVSIGSNDKADALKVEFAKYLDNDGKLKIPDSVFMKEFYDGFIKKNENVGDAVMKEYRNSLSTK